MKALFSRWLPCATLATWSAVLIGIFISGRVRDLLAPEFRIGVLLAGVAMGLMALAFLLFPADASCCSSAECGHSLSRLASGKVLTFLILLLPITAAAMFSPQGFSGNLVKNRGMITDAALLPGAARPSGPPKPVELPLPTNDPAPSDTQAPGTTAAAPPPPAGVPAIQSNVTQPAAPGDYLTRTPEGRIVAEVLDLLYAAQDNALRKDFEDKPVELIGQLMPDTANNAKGNRFKAVRMFMTCCAADARPVATLVESAQKPALPEMSWVKITGTATFPIENGRRIAVLKAEKVEKTQPPEESMLY
jgi:uncharacterized repeat protein (TIGR03943 family)